MNRDHLIAVFMGLNGPERAAEEVLRLREALLQAGDTNPHAKKIADDALAIWPKVDTFGRARG